MRVKKKKSQNTAAHDENELLGYLVPLGLGFLIWKTELLSVPTTLGAYATIKLDIKTLEKLEQL